MPLWQVARSLCYQRLRREVEDQPIGPFGGAIMQIRVLTHNIHKGVSYVLHRRVLSDLREEIRAVSADIVFLQEVRGAYPNEPEPQHDFLAEAGWVNRVYGKNATYKNGHHGNAILSKFELVEDHNQDLSLNRWEQRGLLHAVAEAPDGKPLHLFCLHLNLRKADRLAQTRQVIDHMRGCLGPDDRAILAGDFNDWQADLSSELQTALDLRDAAHVMHGEHARTFPSFYPMLRLDRIYFRGLEIMDFSVLNDARWRGLSDHLPMTADFSLA